MKITKKDKKTINVDVTKFYDRIKKLAEEDIRSFDEEVRYLIKKGLESCDNIAWTYTYNPCYVNSNISDDISNKSGCCDKSTKMQPINEDVVVDMKKAEDGTYVPEV